MGGRWQVFLDKTGVYYVPPTPGSTQVHSTILSCQITFLENLPLLCGNFQKSCGSEYDNENVNDFDFTKSNEQN